MLASSETLIPDEVIRAYYPSGITDQSPIPGGEVNITFLVTDGDDKKTILQRLSPLYDSRVGEDYKVVSGHLTSEGWEMAVALETQKGATYLPDRSGQLWRAFHYIDSTPGREMEGDLEASTALGGLLGALHRSLANLNYVPKFSRPDSHTIVDRLGVLTPQILALADRELASEMISLSHKESIPEEPTQIIHADPRIGNTLFRRGKPFTFIDWDGYKRVNPLIDVGDMLQSTVGEVITKGAGSCSLNQLYPILEAYYAEAELSDNLEAFTTQALAAGRVIALNLGMRHLIDSVENQYFVWDSSKFASRLDFNLFCARRQQQVYNTLASHQSHVQ